MASHQLDPERALWTSGVPFYGPAAVARGREIVRLKIMSDRRAEGGGIAWLVKFCPPPGTLIKIVATALSDEHVLTLSGGRATKSGAPRRSAGGYTLNPKGPAAQRLYRRGDRRFCRLCRRGGRDCLARTGRGRAIGLTLAFSRRGPGG